MRARAALLKGDSALAEQLLRLQEDRAAAASEAKHQEAADLAREIAGLAIGRDSQAALEAFERAAKYQPEDFWTQVQLGDAQAVLGQSKAAMASYKTAQSIVEALAARDPANTEWQRDLSVSHNKIGNVLVAQGDGPGALAAYRKSQDICEALAARDWANAQWQVDLAVSCSRLGDLDASDKAEQREWLQRGLGILRALKDAGRLLPSQDWTAWFEEKLKTLDDDGPAP